jgi:hypothetical protein
MRTGFCELPSGIAAKRVRMTTGSLLVENRGRYVMAIDSTIDGTTSVRPGLSLERDTDRARLDGKLLAQHGGQHADKVIE